MTESLSDPTHKSQPEAKRAAQPRAETSGAQKSGSQKLGPQKLGPRLVSSDPAQSLEVLLNLEGEVRSIEAVPDLGYFMANETRKLIPYRQAIVMTRAASGTLTAMTISSVAMVDRTSPFVVWIESLMARFEHGDEFNSACEFSLPGYCDDDDPQVNEYPFHDALWLPFSRTDEKAFGGMLLLREQPWKEQNLVVGRRLAGAYQHAWSALTAGQTNMARRFSLTRRRSSLIALLIFLAMFLPVSLTTLAPVEVVASDPHIVAAPIQAVIEEILVDPNQPVQKGDLLYRFNDTDFRNRFSIATQDVQVAAVKLRKAKQGAFSSTDAAHELSILAAELSRSQLELAYSKEQLEQVEVRAARSGVVLYSDRKDWVGRPVSVGEQVMRLADPGAVEFGVDVPVKDSIVLINDARVRIYLDADPITPIEARLTSASYHAAELPGQELAYRSTAQLADGEAAQMRIGMRGTAKVYGAKVSMFFYLFRRPISALRQFLGF